MGSRGNCEIVEENCRPGKNWQTYHQVRAQERDKKPPTIKKVLNKSLENDINKLFEAVNLRNAKSLDLSDSWRDPSKKPMKTAGYHSPGVGFSEPVSLKQALRGLCISQAADMAVMKRLSMPSASPRISEEKITSLYRSVVVEGGGSGEVSKESTSFSSRTSPLYREGSVMKSAPVSSCSSPGFRVKPVRKNMEGISSESGRSVAKYGGDNVETSHLGNKLPGNLQEAKTKPLSKNANSSPRNPVPLVINNESALVHKNYPLDPEVDSPLVVTLCSPEEKQDRGSARNKTISPLKKVASGLEEDSVTSTKVAAKSSPKPKRKSKLQTTSPSSSTVKTVKDVKSARNTSRAVKPVIRNRNLVIRKPKKVSASSGGNSEASQEVHGGAEHSSERLVCQKCQCSLTETDKVSSKDHQTTTSNLVPPDIRNCNASKSESLPTSHKSINTPVVKTNIVSKSSEKGDISQSSKSSICDFSSTTTSFSEDSTVSGSIGNRPHMSKDTRWKSINRIKKQYGFLGLSHFNLLKKLGSGDIGTVYLAELVETNCPFAIKVMDNEFLARRKKMARAQTEREIMRMLDHPFLPTLYAQFTSDNLSCLVMEYCPGGDLHVLRQKQPGRYFTEQAARFYVAEVLLALEYLHMLGIVYRDLKPENILVREDGHIMLTDFDLSLRCSVSPTLVKSSSIEPPRVSGPCAGSNCIDPFCTGPSCKLACFSPRLLPTTARARKLKVDAAAQARSLPQLVAEPTDARSNSFVGTHEYLAPEIIKGEGHGSAVDWWTFGVFLYELLYGKTPFKGASNEETLGNVVLQNLKFPDTPIVSFQARDLIRGLLVKEPENRFGTETGAAEIKRHPFFEGLNWALIRCATPPEIPELFEFANSGMAVQGKGKKFVDCGGDGEHLEFELF